MPGRHLPPDHSRGDERTLGGYAAVHARPPAIDGPDGVAYSVEIMVDPVEHGGSRWGAYLLFVKWRRIGASGPEGHLETDYLTMADTEAEARAALGAISLDAVEHHLNELVRAVGGGDRPWWDAMRDEGDA